MLLFKDTLNIIFIKILKCLFPFLISFIISYSLYPFVKFIRKFKVPNSVAVILTIIATFLLIILTIYFALPNIYDQILYFLSVINKFFNMVLDKYSINTNVIKDALSNYLLDKLSKIDEYILSILNISIKYVTNIIIVIVCMIYFLFNMERIRKNGYNFLKRSKLCTLIRLIDSEIKLYIKGIGINMIIQLFEYTIIFMLIGHPNFLLIGFLASVTTVIPVFGGIITGFLALITAFITSKKLFILTIIVMVIFTNIDSYIISPKVYNKTNKIPTILTIISVCIGSLFGMFGIFISIPVLIVIISIFKTYKKSIKDKILHYKEKI